MKNFENIVNGRGVASPQSVESINPATGEVLGRVPQSSAEQVAQAVAEAIRGNAEYLAEWVTREQGKPLGGLGPDQVPGARFEIWGCEVWSQVTANLDLPMERVFEDTTRRDEIHRKPFGVVAAIAPWNWPLLIAVWQMIPAIRAGNTVVIKPSEYTSIGTLEMVRLIAEVLPPGVVNSVSGTGAVGSLLVNNPDVDKILFTGSGPTGARIAAAARHLTPTTMELGGNDAAIVLPGADPKAMAMGLFWGAFLNMGQACAKRLYVHDSPSIERMRDPAQMPSVLGAAMDARDPGVAAVWSTRHVVVIADAATDPLIGPGIRRTLLAAQTRRKLAVALRDDGRDVGLLCVDGRCAATPWTADECRLLDRVASEVAGPILGTSRRLGGADGGSDEGRQDGAAPAARPCLTPAELRVARLVLVGLSYKEIARQLDRSSATIDHQLRSMRLKLGVNSTAKLMRELAGLAPTAR